MQRYGEGLKQPDAYATYTHLIIESCVIAKKINNPVVFMYHGIWNGAPPFSILRVQADVQSFHFFKDVQSIITCCHMSCRLYFASPAMDLWHYNDVIMKLMASPITIVSSTGYSGADQRKHQSFASLAFVRETHGWSVNSPQKGQ